MSAMDAAARPLGSDGDRTPSRASGYRLTLPPDWFGLPLDGRRRTSLSRLLRGVHVPPELDEVTVRRALRAELERTTARAAQGGVRDLWVCVGWRAGCPVPAALAVGQAPAAGGVGAVESELRAAGEHPQRVLVGGEQACLVSDVVEERGLPLVQVRIHAPVPGRDEVLLLTFSTPVLELAEPYEKVFRAIAGALRWT